MKTIKREVLHPDGSITYIEEPYEVALERIKKLLEEDKELLEILEKL